MFPSSGIPGGCGIGVDMLPVDAVQCGRLQEEKRLSS